MAFDIAGAMRYAQPVTAMHEGRAMRLANQHAEQGLAIGAQEQELNALKLQAMKGGNPEEQRAAEAHRMKRASEFLTTGRELHAQTYSLYDELKKSGKSEDEARAAAQTLWDKNRRSVMDAYGKEFGVQLDEDGVWTPEESLAGVQQADALLKQLGGGTDTPAETQSFEDLAKAAGLDEKERAQAARVKLGLEPRAGQRVIEVPQPDGTVQRVVYDIGTGTVNVLGQGRAPEAEAREKVLAEAEAADLIGAPKRLAAANEAVAQIENNLMPVFDNVAANADAWTIGVLSSASLVPGSAAADLKANVDTLLANTAFDRLQEMRANSPTGGALGSITERELDLLGSTRAALLRSQSPEQFRENLGRLKQHYQRVLGLAKQATRRDQLKTQLLELRRRPASSERDQRISRAQERIGAIEDAWWDSLESESPLPSTATPDETTEERVARLRAENAALEAELNGN